MKKSNDKIKAKINALLQKTTANGASQQEMESALKKANQLMLEYFISEHDLKDFKIIEKCILKEVPLIKSGYDFTLFYHALSQLFDCEHFYNSKRIAFFGFEQDTEFCAYFYNVIINACIAEKNRYIKTEHYAQMKKQHHGRTLISSFIKGFQISVAKKMTVMYEERKRNVPESYGLMVLEKEKEVQLQYEEMNFKVRKIKDNIVTIEQEVFDKGKEAGEKLDLIQGINACENHNLMLN